MVTLNPNFHARPILYDIKQSPTDFDTIVTEDAYSDPAYTWITTFMGQKILIFSVADEDAEISVTASHDGVNYRHTLMSDEVVTAGNTHEVAIPDFYASIRIYARSATSGKVSTVTVQCIGTSHAPSCDARAAFAYEAVTVTSLAVAELTAATYDGAIEAMISVESNPVRARWDGVAPTTATGHLLQQGDIVTLYTHDDIVDFQAIAVGSSSVLTITYSR